MSDSSNPIPPGQPTALAIPLPTATTQEWLVARIAEIIGVDTDRIDPRADVRDFDLDSTEVLILVAELEARLGVRIDAGLLWTARNLSALAGYATSVAAAETVDRPRLRLVAQAA
ncbi:MAG: acyl carrier protein [Dermatophilaceae bacterium]